MMPMPWKPFRNGREPCQRHGHGPRGTHGIHAARSVEGQTGRARAPDAVAGETLAWRRLAALMPTIDEFFGTSNQVCCGFWPFGTDMAPAGRGGCRRAKPDDGLPACAATDQLVQGPASSNSPLCSCSACRPSARARSCAARCWDLSALGMNAIIPGDLKPTTPSLVNMRAAGHPAGSGHRRGQPPWTPATSIMRCNAWRARRART